MMSGNFFFHKEFILAREGHIDFREFFFCQPIDLVSMPNYYRESERERMAHNYQLLIDFYFESIHFKSNEMIFSTTFVCVCARLC